MAPVGTTCALTTTGAPANAPTLLALALGQAAAIPFGGCVLRLDPPTMVPHGIGAASATGQFVATLVIPNSLDLLAFPLTAQALPLLSNGPFLGLGELSTASSCNSGTDADVDIGTSAGGFDATEVTVRVSSAPALRRDT